MDAHRVEHDLVAHLRGEQLGHARLDVGAPPRVLAARGLHGQEARRLDLRRHVGELELDRLQLGELPAERLAPAGVRHRELVGAPRGADRAGRDVHAPDLDARHHLLEAAADARLAAEHRARGHAVARRRMPVESMPR